MPGPHWLGDQGAKRVARRAPYSLLEPIETVGDAQGGSRVIQGDNPEAPNTLGHFDSGRASGV
jgi:adenine-specific DNA-methyltransferase